MPLADCTIKAVLDFNPILQNNEVQMARSITLKQLPNLYGISRLAPTDDFPLWINGDGFLSVTRTTDELSIVCEQDRIPRDVQSSLDWVCFQFVGPFAFDDTGIVSSVIQPLSDNKIGIFVVSTYDGDHLLIQRNHLDQAIGILTSSGHVFL